MKKLNKFKILSAAIIGFLAFGNLQANAEIMTPKKAVATAFLQKAKIKIASAFKLNKKNEETELTSQSSIHNGIEKDIRFKDFFGKLQIDYWKLNIKNPESTEKNFQKLIHPLIQLYANAPEQEKIQYQETISEISKYMSQDKKSAKSIFTILATLPQDIKKLMLSYIKSPLIKFYLSKKIN